MVARRVEMHRLQELVRLHRMSSGAREVARILGMSPNTERRYREALAEAGLLNGDADSLPDLVVLRTAVAQVLCAPKSAVHSVSSVTSWQGDIETMFERDAGPTAIYDALRLKPEFTGSLSAVKRVVMRLQAKRGVKATEVAIPVDTAPGEVAQVDFGYVGRLYDPLAGVARKAWVFVMVLGFSRHMYVRIVFDQSITTWIDCHVRAFAALGGVPRVVVPDNLKSAVIRAAFSNEDDVELNRSYRELARHYGFKIDPTPPRSPKHKGKVESGVKYVKNNFFKPRDFTDSDVSTAQRELDTWTSQIANERIHGTTGHRPREMFEAHEHNVLLPLPARQFEMALWKKAKVHADSHVILDKRMYSVPWRLIGKTVWLKATADTVIIYADDVRVTTHDRRGPGNRSTVEEHLPEGRRDYRERQREYWEGRAADIDKVVGDYITAVFDSDDVLLQLRTAQNIVRHLETFPKERARKTCARAHYYSNFKYGAVKDILRKGLDIQDLPVVAPAPADPATPSRFARDASELVNPNLELFAGSTGDDEHGYN